MGRAISHGRMPDGPKERLGCGGVWAKGSTMVMALMVRITSLTLVRFLALFKPIVRLK